MATHKRLSIFGASLAVIAAATSIGAAPAFAQDQDGASLEEIVITAQRREESLQDVPIAITAFTQEDLERTAAVGIQDVASRAPGVTLTQFNIGEPQLYIRGVGTTSDSAASDPSIGISIDEVSIGRAGASSLAFLDVNRVEILRGPQGTLYGRNASGGALNVYTNAPTFDTGGHLSVRAGSFDMYGAEGVFNLGLGENSAARFAAQYSTNDGYAEYAPTGQSLEGGTQWGARAQLLTEAGDWSFLAGIDYSNEDMDGHARIPVTTAATNPGFTALINGLRTGLDIRQSFSSPDNYQQRENYGVTFRAEREGQAFNFVSLTSYRNNDYSWRDNLGGLPFPGFPLAVDDRASEASDQISQEFRIVSPDSSAINWVAGVYFMQENVERDERFIVQAALPIAPPSFGGDTSFLQDATNTSYAAFGQMTIPFAEVFEFTAGVRWTHDDREIHQIALDNDVGGLPPVGIPLGPTGSPYNVTADESFEEPTWRLALSVEPVDQARFYVSYDRGYKAGSFVSGAQNALQAGTPIRSEILDNYAVGMKTTWMDGRFRFNAEAFLLDYSDLQVYELLGLNLATSNADAQSSGIEIETAFALNENITIGGSYTRLQAQYTSNATSTVGTLLYDGHTLPRSPEHQYNAFVDGEWDLWGGAFAARVNYQWADEFYFDPSNNPEVLEDAHGLLGAFASWESPSGLTVAVYGKNLTDEDYRLHVIKNVGIGFSVFGPPQEFGVSLTQRF
ncbi:TonB-dependent receptor [Candidatus Viadribacter manganicus]|uniref:TonB-dependent receptor n=1 Tax=Candidatus Viadribacter manganicus TaxID=1759059 RepID=UPI000830D58D|nr:TonB-dependent receptor [Candidatus Viadribacter manganicus]